MSILGWIANLFVVAGLVTIGRKWPHAFAFTAVGEILWCVKAAKTRQWDILSICVVFAVVALFNWYQWTRGAS